MRLRRVRYTIRRMMITLGLAALLMWPVALGRYYGGLAVEHDLQFDRVYQAMQGSPEWKEWERLNRAWVGLGSAPEEVLAEQRIIAAARRVSDDLEQRYVRKIQYHRAMARKYHDAAAHPWLSISSDPAPPG